MRGAVLLLLAATVGFLAGRLTAPGERGRGGGRAVPLTPQRERDAPEASASVRVEETPESAADPVEGEADAVLPSESADVEAKALGEDQGLLLVDLAGIPGPREAWVGTIDIVGAFDEQGMDASDEGDVVQFTGEAGVYDVWWLDGAGLRLGTRARLEAGRITRVIAADHRTAAPIPKGLGVLRFFVEAAGGGGLSAQVYLSAGSSSLDAWTNETGHGCRVMRPGRYDVSVSAHRSEAVVKEGETTFHRIEHGREGDLVLAADRHMNVVLRRSADADVVWSHWIGAPPGSETSIPYLAEGQYDVLIPYSGGVPLARLAVHAGRATRFRCDPPGGVSVRLTLPGGDPSDRAQVAVARFVDGVVVDGGSRGVLAADGFEAPLMPGRYRVTAFSEGRERDSAEFEVSDRVVELALELSRAR